MLPMVIFSRINSGLLNSIFEPYRLSYSSHTILYSEFVHSTHLQKLFQWLPVTHRADL